MPLAPIGAIIRDMGATRISKDIKEQIGDAMEAYGCQLARKAVAVAALRGESTVKAKHLRLALDMEDEQSMR